MDEYVTEYGRSKGVEGKGERGEALEEEYCPVGPPEATHNSSRPYDTKDV